MGIVVDPQDDAERIKLPGFYIGENVTNTPTQVAQHGNTTYAWIQTWLELAATARVNDAGTAIEYIGDPIAQGEIFHLIRLNGVRDYICKPENVATVVAFLGNEYTPADVFNFPYPDGCIYYRVFLNQVGTDPTSIAPEDKYNVYRNQFMHLNVLAVNVNGNGPGGFGKGYPGDEDDPRIPINPFTPNPGGGEPPVNPNPHTRPEPIDEEEATLKVNVEIKPWEYSFNGITLQ
ncbi:MAG: fimbria major subunit [Bacteroides sp.]|nr:fimbria major subunit [Bacteroides sp.]